MATTRAISANAEKNNGATLLHAGNHDGQNITKNLTLATNAHHPDFSARVVLAVSPTSSGNLGTIKPLSAGVFGRMEAGQYVAKIIGTRVAQTDDTFLRSGAAETAHRTSLHYGRGNHRYHITDWSYTTGAATKGGNAGVSFTYHDPIAGSAIAKEPFPNNAVPGELVYFDGSPNPVQDDYKARQNP